MSRIAPVQTAAEPPSRGAETKPGSAAPSERPSAAPLLSASLPVRFGRYTLFEPIGRGGMAELFLARSESELGATRLAVVKLILPAFAEDPKFSEMLIHEAKLAARLSHRHIVQVLDLGRDAPLPSIVPCDPSAPESRPAMANLAERLYIAMEYVEGLDLNALLRRCSEIGVPLPPEHALGIVADILEGLDYAHRRTSDTGAPLGIVHRDVSPSNVLISYDGEVKICDFGIAHANDLVSSDKNEALKGKASYMSPEHARAEPLDARADVFAAGIILWELLSGRRLYRLRGDVPLLEQARRAEIPPIPDRNLPNQEELERIVSRALAKNRDERYPTASAFQRDLEGYLAGAGLLASRLKLGEWIAATFGTKVIEERRASERRLPKSSVPPPRSSGAIRVRSATAPHVEIPAAPRVPNDLIALTTDGDASTPPASDARSNRLLRTKEAEPKPLSQGSLEGVAMDSPVSSGSGGAAPKDGPPEPSSEELPKAEGRGSASSTADDDLLAWARKRGWITFTFFFLVATSIAVIWYLSQ